MLEQDHEAILDALAGGLSIPKAAEQFRLPVDDVRKILKDEIARCRDGERLRQTWMLADRRLQAAELRFYKKAMEEGDCASAIVFVKISERRATLNGANMPQAHVLQVVSAPPQTQMNGTERILAVLAYVPSSSEIDEALICRKAFTDYFRVGDINRLGPTERKSLSSFAFGGTGWLAPPQMSDQILSCLVDPTDLSGFVNHVPISGASIKFPIDNARFNVADWACSGNCFHNNPLPDLQEGIGELEIRAESLRFVCCAGNDLLADASFPIETWLFDKVSRGFRAQINYSILLGDGLSKPIGLLNPLSGVPICETGQLTPAGQFSWQDLVLLAFDVPMQWHVGSAFYMNQRTFALLLTMSTAEGRPLFGQLPSGAVGPQLAGFPIRIASQLPDVGAGSTPVLFGNLKSAYTIADRQALTVMVDPYSAGFCTIFKWEARLGGASTCPNSVRLLRIK